MENSIGGVLNEILSYRQKSLPLYIIGFIKNWFVLPSNNFYSRYTWTFDEILDHYKKIYLTEDVIYYITYSLILISKYKIIKNQQSNQRTRIIKKVASLLKNDN